jgi:DNA-directed RNA polymerase specialized sigma24 family protein
MPSNLTRRSDDALIQRVRAGDVEAFPELHDRHAARALRLARAVCHDSEEAERAVEEGFLAIWRRREGYRPAGVSRSGGLDKSGSRTA